MFYFVSCLLGFSVLLGITLSLFFLSPDEVLPSLSGEMFSKDKLFERYSLLEEQFKKGLVSKEDWEREKAEILHGYERFV